MPSDGRLGRATISTRRLVKLGFGVGLSTLPSTTTSTNSHLRTGRRYHKNRKCSDVFKVKWCYRETKLIRNTFLSFNLFYDSEIVTYSFHWFLAGKYDMHSPRLRKHTAVSESETAHQHNDPYLQERHCQLCSAYAYWNNNNNGRNCSCLTWLATW